MLTRVFPTKVNGSVFGPRAREKTHMAYAVLSSQANSKLLRPRRCQKIKIKVKLKQNNRVISQQWNENKQAKRLPS